MPIVNNAVTTNTAQSKTAGTSIVINNGDITVAAGDDIFVGYAGDDVGSAFGVSHAGTASITWTQIRERINAAHSKAQLWRGVVTAGGTVTTVTVSWTTNVTAKAAVMAWFSGVGTQDTGTGSPYDNTGTSNSGATVPSTATATWESGDLVVMVMACEASAAKETVNIGAWAQTTTETLAGSNGTSGGSDPSNMICGLGYSIVDASGSVGGTAINWTNAAQWSAVAAVFSPSGYQPRHSAINFQEPGLLAKAWERGKSGVWLPPKLWTPRPKLALA